MFKFQPIHFVQLPQLYGQLKTIYNVLNLLPKVIFCLLTLLPQYFKDTSLTPRTTSSSKCPEINVSSLPSFQSISSTSYQSSLQTSSKNANNTCPRVYDSDGINLTIYLPPLSPLPQTIIINDVKSTSQIHKPPISNNIDSMHVRVKTGVFKPKALNITIILRIHITVKEAMKHKEWMDAMHKELEALMRNGTWDLVSPQDNQ